MATVAPFRAQQYQFGFKITGVLPESLDHLREGAMKLATSRGRGMLLKAATAESLLPAYRQRFLAHISSAKNVREQFLAKLPGMVNMRREHFNRADPTLDRALVRRFLRASARVSDAKSKGDAKALISARKAADSVRDSIRSQVKPKPAARRPFPSSGRFRSLAFRVMDLIADVNEAHVHGSANETLIGIGHLASLDRIKTPSATSQLTGHATRSTRNILWRHLEFGTGAFAIDKSAQQRRHRLPSGGWWYGRNIDMSLRLRGSKPGRIMGDPARRLPYTAELTRTIMSVNQMMAATLFGH